MRHGWKLGFEGLLSRTKTKGDDLAEFKRELLAEVRNTIKGASVAPSGSPSRRSSTVEADDSKGAEEQGTLATRERLASEIQELRKMLGPDHVEVTKRCVELESLRQQRPLHTRVLDGQRRLEKATKKVMQRRKEMAEADEEMDRIQAKRDKAFNELQTAQEEELRAKQGQAELLRSFRGVDPPPEEAGPSLSSVREALDRLSAMASADEAGSAAKQLLEVAKNELAALERSLKSPEGETGAGLDAMDAASEPGTDDIEAWTNDLVGEVGEESRERVRSRITKRIGESGWQLVRKKGKRAGIDK